MPTNSQRAYTPAGDMTPTQYGAFNPPDITDRGEIKNRPISSALQAYSIFRRLDTQNLHRANRNKQVADAQNGSPPFAQDKLNAANQGWRSNWSRQAFSNTVDRVKPRFTKAVGDQKYLTNSVLPDSFPDAAEKTDILQEGITKVIRQWSGWTDFVDNLATEDLVYGYTAAVHLSQFDWRPRTFRQEEILFDDNTATHASRLECFAVKVDYYINELLELIEVPDIAEDMGYNLPNIINAIRHAMPVRDSFVYNPRQLADMVREGSMFYSRQKEARMIQTAHVFVVNYEGKVDHWWINRSPLGRGKQDGQMPTTSDDEVDSDESGIELLFSEAYAKSMEDIITLLTFEPGNGRLHGSKGMGRKLYNVSLAMDKLFNAMLDNLYLSSLLMGTIDASKVAALQPQIRLPFLIFPDGFVPAEQPQLQVNLQAFEYGMNQLQALLDQVAGTFMPDQYANTGNHITDTSATEASIDAAREDEIKQGVLNRWWNQIQQCVEAMQRRICSKENLQAAIEFKKDKDEALEEGRTLVPQEVIEVIEILDPHVTDSFEQEPDLMHADIEAVKILVEIMDKNVEPQEIYVWANQSATNFTTNVGAAEDQRIIQFAQAVEANPQFAAFFDQEKLARMASNAAIGSSRTDELFQPMPQQTTAVAAGRQQIMEFSAMLAGESMQVDPRDPHQVHLQTLGDKMNAWLQTMSQMPPLSIPHEWITAGKLMIEHEGSHIQKLIEQGMTEKALKPQIDMFRLHEETFKRIAASVAGATHAQEQTQMMAQQGGAPGAPGGANPAMSMPPGGPPGNIPPGIFPPGQAGPIPQQIGA